MSSDFSPKNELDKDRISSLINWNYDSIKEEREIDKSDMTLFGEISNYKLKKRIGRGKYSNVFSGRKINPDGTKTPIVVKVLKPVHEVKIRREIVILNEIRGCPYLARLDDVVLDTDSLSICLVLGYSKNNDIKTLAKSMTIRDVACYIFSVLKALEYAHSKNIMHRDVKPGNIMWDMKSKKAVLIDWGLAEFYKPGSEYHCRVSTKHYKGPELLLNYKMYTPTLDIWCLGCTLAAILFFQHPFFKGNETEDQIINLSKIIGPNETLMYIKKYEINASFELRRALEDLEDRGWDNFFRRKITDQNIHLCTPEALDLLKSMLIIDHGLRPSAKQCMEHAFFDQVRNLFE